LEWPYSPTVSPPHLEVDGSGIKEEQSRPVNRSRLAANSSSSTTSFVHLRVKGELCPLILDPSIQESSWPGTDVDFSLRILGCRSQKDSLCHFSQQRSEPETKRPVQNRQKDRPFDIELELAALQETSDGPSDLQVPPQALEIKAGPIELVCALTTLFAVRGSSRRSLRIWRGKRTKAFDVALFAGVLQLVPALQPHR